MTAALSVQGLVKNFAGTRALDGADLVIETGTVHGLVGQNGAGKSTLIRVLAGLQRADGGSIDIAGHRLIGPELPQPTPAAVARLGLGFIHQDRLLAPSSTVAEALFLGREPRIRFTFLIDRARLRRQARDALRTRFDLDLPVDALIGELTAGQQQIVQITRALLDRPRLLVFDEPTASLVRRDVEHLAAAIARLRQEGVSILYVSHYLDEIEQLCDRVTILRNGRTAGVATPRDVPLSRIVNLMVGRDVATLFPPRDRTPGRPLLDVSGLTRPGAYDDVTFTVRAGEILGITGVLGCGGKRLLRTLFGDGPPASGTIALDGRIVRLPSPRAAIAQGIALVPEDRRAEGLAGRLTVGENLTLPSLAEFARRVCMDRTAQNRAADELIDRHAIRTGGRDQPAAELSGGNQQKIVLAKWLRRGARIFLFDEPAVGVDIAAKAEIYALIAAIVAKGNCAVIFSSDLEELTGLADRILVLYRGRIAAEHPGAGASPAILLAAATGARQEGQGVVRSTLSRDALAPLATGPQTPGSKRLAPWRAPGRHAGGVLRTTPLASSP